MLMILVLVIQLSAFFVTDCTPLISEELELEHDHFVRGCKFGMDQHSCVKLEISQFTGISPNDNVLNGLFLCLGGVILLAGICNNILADILYLIHVGLVGVCSVH